MRGAGPVLKTAGAAVGVQGRDRGGEGPRFGLAAAQGSQRARAGLARGPVQDVLGEGDQHRVGPELNVMGDTLRREVLDALPEPDRLTDMTGPVGGVKNAGRLPR